MNPQLLMWKSWHSLFSRQKWFMRVSITPSPLKRLQKHPSWGVLRKNCSENMQQIYRKTSMPKCDFNKISLKLLLRLRGGGGEKYGSFWGGRWVTWHIFLWRIRQLYQKFFKKTVNFYKLVISIFFITLHFVSFTF